VNLLISFKSIVIFTILILPMDAHGRLFHLVSSGFYSFCCREVFCLVG
jgi:hypothetical protein